MNEVNEARRDLALEKKFNFGIVVQGKIYRSAQPDEKLLHYLKDKCGIKTIVVLRTNIPEFEEKFCRENGIALMRLPVKSWRRWPEPEEIQDFFQLFQDQENQPILVHCREGKDRTSAIVALWRIGVENWGLKEVMFEMKNWKANWFWRLFIRTRAGKIIQGFEEKRAVFLYLARFLNLIFGLEGLVYAIRYEKNLQIFLGIEFALLMIAIFYGGMTTVEFSLALVAFGLFNAFEMFNSAVERLIDMANPQFDYRIKVIKDILAGGVIFAGVTAFLVYGLLLFF